MLLNAALAEDIQRARTGGKDIRPTIAAISDATLSGLMEYACLRSTDSEYPELPATLKESSFWGSDFLRPDVRRDGSNLRSREVGWFGEFENGVLQSQRWESFQYYFTQAAQTAGLQSSVADALAAAMHEMTENAILHSSAIDSVVVGYRAANGESTFCVTDVGIGVLASLRLNPTHSQLKRHSEAIRLALQDGVSRFPDGGGFGFRSIFKAVVAQWGGLRFRSGEGCLEMHGQDLHADTGQISFPPALPGFQVTVSARSCPNNS